MNPGLTDEHSSIRYYDSDYPSAHLGRYPENFDETTEFQGIAHDVERYAEIAGQSGGPILELCCGSGRVAIPLARAGHSIVAVDLSTAMLEQFRATLQAESGDVHRRVTLRREDARSFALDERFALVIIAFNSLLCIPDFDDQCAVLERVAAHLAPRGILALDIVNPLQLQIKGDAVPKPFFTRRHCGSGNLYTRFAMAGPFDEQHRQRLHGWYDEMQSDGRLERRPYEIVWRPIFRHEIQLMLERAGLQIATLEGGHRHEPYAADSPRLFIEARRRAV